MTEDRSPKSAAPQHASVRLEGRFRLPELLARCDALHRGDKGAEKTRKWTGILLVLLSCALIFGLPLWWRAIDRFLVGNLDAWALAFFVALAGFIASLVKFRRAGQRDLEDRKLWAAYGLLSALAREIDHRRPVEIRVDFSAYDANHRVRFVLKTGQRNYGQRWLKLRMTLANGSEVLITARSRCKHRFKRKAKRVSHKYTVKEELEVTIHPAKGAPFNPALDAAIDLEPTREVHGLRLVRHRIKRKIALFRYRTGPATWSYGRSLWGENLLDENSLLAATIMSFRLAHTPPGEARQVLPPPDRTAPTGTFSSGKVEPAAEQKSADQLRGSGKFDEARAAVAHRNLFWTLAGAVIVVLLCLTYYAIRWDVPQPRGAEGEAPTESPSPRNPAKEPTPSPIGSSEKPDAGSVPVEPATTPILSVHSQPSGATVTINGVVYGKTPLIMSSPPGLTNASVRLERDGHRPWRGRLTPNEAGHLSVNAALSPIGRR